MDYVISIVKLPSAELDVCMRWGTCSGCSAEKVFLPPEFTLDGGICAAGDAPGMATAGDIAERPGRRGRKGFWGGVAMRRWSRGMGLFVDSGAPIGETG
jgi:hypothetical protein